MTTAVTRLPADPILYLKKDDPPPLLLSAKVSYSETVYGIESHLGRTWDFAGRGACHLCPACTVDVTGHCQIKVNTFVHEDDAADFSVIAFLDGA